MNTAATSSGLCLGISKLASVRKRPSWNPMLDNSVKGATRDSSSGSIHIGSSIIVTSSTEETELDTNCDSSVPAKEYNPAAVKHLFKRLDDPYKVDRQDLSFSSKQTAQTDVDLSCDSSLEAADQVSTDVSRQTSEDSEEEKSETEEKGGSPKNRFLNKIVFKENAVTSSSDDNNNSSNYDSFIIGSDARNDMHEALHSFESARRVAYTRRMRAFRSQWGTSVDLLRAKVIKTSRIERNISGRAFTRNDIRTQVDNVRTLGSTVKEELKLSESNVKQAWNAYDTMTADFSLEGVGRVDEWVLEMKYSVAVEYQSSLWRLALHELSNVCQSIRLRLCAHCDMLQRALSTLDRSSSSSSLLTSASNDTMNTSEADKYPSIFHYILDKGSESTVPSLVSPETSKLVMDSKVIERKNSNGDWQRALAIVTVDRLMHLFDVPSTETSGTATLSANDAFMELLPTLKLSVVESAQEEELSSSSSVSSSKSLKKIFPRQSIFLPNVSYSQDHVVENRNDFEMMEVFLGDNGNYTTRKISLRTESPKETAIWVNIISDNAGSAYL